MLYNFRLTNKDHPVVKHLEKLSKINKKSEFLRNAVEHYYDFTVVNSKNPQNDTIEDPVDAQNRMYEEVLKQFSLLNERLDRLENKKQPEKTSLTTEKAGKDTVQSDTSSENDLKHVAPLPSENNKKRQFKLSGNALVRIMKSSSEEGAGEELDAAEKAKNQSDTKIQEENDDFYNILSAGVDSFSG